MIFDNYQLPEEMKTKKREPYKPKPAEIFKTIKKQEISKKTKTK